jgi:uncharacterized protein
MTAFYMDTSAIIKRYVSEVGPAWITALAQPAVGNIIIIARLTTVEGCSVLARLQRLKHLTATDGNRLRNDFLVHADHEYLTVAIDDTILKRSCDLVAKYPLRALDAIQLAYALEATTALGEALTFLSQR